MVSTSMSPHRRQQLEVLAIAVQRAFFPHELAALGELVAKRDWAASRREMRRLMDIPDERTLGIIARCVMVLAESPHPRIAAARLKYLATTSDPDDNPIILAFLPGHDYRSPRPAADPTPAPVRWPGFGAPYRPAGPVRITRQPPAPRRQRRTAEHGVAEAYQRERGGVDDQPPPRERPVGYEHDYDTDALEDLRELPCVACTCERSSLDQRRADGLCEDCREAGRPGIPGLPARHSVEQAITARCAFLMHTKGPGAPAALRQLRRQVRGSRAHRAVAAFLDAHPQLSTLPA